MGTIILSAFVAHTAWHWMTERWEALRMFNVAWPAMDAGGLASLLRVAMVVVAAVGLLWVAGVVRRRRSPGERGAE
jgi:hypothetical protein